MPDRLRRNMLKGGAWMLGAGAMARSMAPLVEWAGRLDMDELLQRHYKELSRADMAEILARIEARVLEERGVEVRVEDVRPQEGVGFGYALNLSACVGCRRCAEACHKENNHDRATHNSYIRVLKIPKGTLSLNEVEVDYGGAVPEKGHFYMPVQCHQCDNPPCVSVCPIEATWKEADGIVVVDYDWCIGCRYCQAACPYHARRFNWDEPVIPPEEINPEQAYLSNRIRPAGVAEKCTFCLHRTRVGELPACLEVCPTGSRVFGDLNDPDSEIRWVLANKRVFVLKEDLGTLPRFFYFFDV
jgi:Fe-S-cluster-containing dehydrogenase component